MKNNMKVYADDAIQFWYNGFTHTVYVTEEGENDFRGWDFTENQLSTFSYDKIDNLAFLEGEDLKTINVKGFPGELSDPQVWVEKYQKEGYRTFVTNDTEVIAVAITVNRELRGYYRNRYFCFTKKNGGTRGVKICKHGEVSLFDNRVILVKKATAEDLIKFLSE